MRRTKMNLFKTLTGTNTHIGLFESFPTIGSEIWSLWRQNEDIGIYHAFESPAEINRPIDLFEGYGIINVLFWREN